MTFVTRVMPGLRETVMKNFVIVIIVTMWVAIGCIVMNTSASAETFAYLSYEDGKIVPYKIVNGVFSAVNVNEIKVGKAQSRLASDFSGQLVYVSDLSGAISCFTVSENGALGNSKKNETDIKDYLSECIVDPSGKYLYVAVSGHNEDNISGGKVAQFSIQPDGALKSMDPAFVESGCAPNRLAFNPSGKYLYVGHHGGSGGILGYVVGADGKLTPMPADYTSGLINDCTEMTMTSDGAYLLVGDDRDLKLKCCSVDSKGRLAVTSIASFPEGFDMGGIMSVAVDSFGNVMIITPSRYLSTYKIDNGTLLPNGEFMCLKDGRFLTKDNMDGYIKGTNEYAQAFEKRAKLESDERELYSLMATYHGLCSQLQAVRVGSDGPVYVLSTSGVYRFQSTKDGIVPSGPAITWPDTLDTIRNRSLPTSTRNAVKPRVGGMTIVERK